MQTRQRGEAPNEDLPTTTLQHGVYAQVSDQSVDGQREKLRLMLIFALVEILPLHEHHG